MLAGTLEGWAYTKDNDFYPDKTATREEVVWMLVGALQITCGVFDFEFGKTNDLTRFKDSPSPFARTRMSLAVGNNIIEGYPDGTLKP